MERRSDRDRQPTPLAVSRELRVGNVEERVEIWGCKSCDPSVLESRREAGIEQAEPRRLANTR